jgi:hypothetical protein
MTITYPKGTVLRAIVLSHEEHEIRAVAPGCDDVLIFTRANGTWISEELEPVTFEFEWQRRGTPRLFQEDEYICPRALADHLIGRLHGHTEPDLPEADTLYVFSPNGARVAIRRTDLVPM